MLRSSAGQKTRLSPLLVCSSRKLLALHRTSVLRHDELGQEMLINLLLRNYLHYNLYDQVSLLQLATSCSYTHQLSKCRNVSRPECIRSGREVLLCWQAEKLRAKAQRPENPRSSQQLCRYSASKF